MKIREFIHDKLSELVLLFPSSSVSYGHETHSNIHIIEILPSELYHLNTDFQKWERELIKEFEAKFPQDLLSIISEDADLPIEKIDFAFSGVGQKEEHNEWSFYIPTDIYPYPVGSRYNNFINLFNTISEAPLIRDVDYVQFHYSFDNALMTEMRTPLGIAAFNEYSFIHLQNKLAINWMNVLPIPEPATEIFERCNNSDLPLAA